MVEPGFDRGLRLRLALGFKMKMPRNTSVPGRFKDHGAGASMRPSGKQLGLSCALCVGVVSGHAGLSLMQTTDGGTAQAVGTLSAAGIGAMALVLGVMLRGSIAVRRQRPRAVPGRFLFVGGVIFPLAAVSAGLALNLPEPRTAEAFAQDSLPDAPRPFPSARAGVALAPVEAASAATDLTISHEN